MFSYDTILGLLIEFYVLGIAGHFLLLATLINETRPEGASDATGKRLKRMAFACSLLWPGMDVLLMLAILTPLGTWFQGWVARKYGTGETS